MIREKIVNNKIIQTMYKGKFYLDLGMAQISFVTSKLPEIMAAVYLTEKAGITIGNTTLWFFALCLFSGLIMFGWFWSKSGLYSTEIYVQADKNPMSKEILEAARIIKKWEKERETNGG